MPSPDSDKLVDSYGPDSIWSQLEAVLPASGDRATPDKPVLVVGMGGSALSARILNYLFTETVSLWSSYDLPPFVEQFDPWVICISHSGNTTEVLSAYDAARKKVLDISVITGGGELLQRAESDNIPRVIVPSEVEPRESLGYLLNALTSLLEINLSPQINFKAMKDRLREQSNQIVDFVSSTIPVIYSDQRDEALGYLWKIKFNENAKRPSFSNVLPEANHNELIGLAGDVNPSNNNLSGLFLGHRDVDQRILRRMQLTAEIYEDNEIPSFPVHLEGNTRLDRFLYASALSDMVTFRIAENHGVDPHRTEIISRFKQAL